MAKVLTRILGFLASIGVGCRGCGRCIGKDSRFCSWCGAENPDFAPEVVVSLHGQPIEYYLRTECDTGHGGFQEEFRTNPDARPMPYCPFCGFDARTGPH